MKIHERWEDLTEETYVNIQSEKGILKYIKNIPQENKMLVKH